MKPVVVIIGRPNVGKSTLFNRLTKSRNAIVVDVPGVTRDRHYGEGRLGEREFLVVDTGGLEPDAHEGIYFEMARQTEQAIAEADAVVWVVDARSGLTSADRTIAAKLRKLDRRVWIAANKAEGLEPNAAVAEFHELALGEPCPISAAHGEGVRALIEAVLEPFPAEREPVDSEDAGPRVAIVGRPNVGKSTLVNALVGENRVIAFDQPGTTRDPIEVPFEIGDRRYTLIDTAGLRRRGKQGEAEEHFSVIKALQAIEAANVAVLVLDAAAGITDQDTHVAGYVLERGRAVVVAVNKWDAADKEARERIKQELAWKFVFLGYAPPIFLSALERRGLSELLAAVDRAFRSAMARMSTPKLTRALIAAVERQQPPRRKLGRPKMRYAHQGGMNPPRIVIHGNALEGVPETYRRYLEGYFRKQFALEGTPLAIEFRTGRNPYVKRD
ncbi:MAG: ribosome biogenesis GTPase Der [Betaproteobacteria bacterium]|nr:ribosome biogenesis GTPase Der [Betaproteobacteria bacterium]